MTDSRAAQPGDVDIATLVAELARVESEQHPAIRAIRTCALIDQLGKAVASSEGMNARNVTAAA